MSKSGNIRIINVRFSGIKGMIIVVRWLRGFLGLVLFLVIAF